MGCIDVAKMPRGTNSKMQARVDEGRDDIWWFTCAENGRRFEYHCKKQFDLARKLHYKRCNVCDPELNGVCSEVTIRDVSSGKRVYTNKLI